MSQLNNSKVTIDQGLIDPSSFEKINNSSDTSRKLIVFGLKHTNYMYKF